MIRRNFIILSVIAVCLAGVAASFVFSYHVGGVIEGLVQRRGEILLLAVSKQAMEAVQRGDFGKGLEGVVKSLMRDPDVDLVSIVDGDGNIIAHSDPEKRGRKQNLTLWDQQVMKSALPSIRYDEVSQRYVLGAAIEGPRSFQVGGVETSLPVGGSSISFGAIFMGLSQAKIKSQIGKTNVIVWISIAVVALITSFLVALVTRKIVEPLRDLSRATKVLADGNLNAQVPVRSEDEIGELAESFNKMTKRLRETTVSKNQLESVVQNKTMALKETNETLLEANLELKNLQELEARFVSMASHELRTPLTSISGFATLLQKYGSRLTSEQSSSYIGAITSEAARLGRMINEILDLKQIQHGRIQLHAVDFDLKVLAEDVVAELRVRPDQPNYKVSFEGSLKAHLDEDKVKQILINLTGNASKYTPVGKTVTIEGMLVNDKTIVINVRDEGPGIPRELWKKLFHPFARANDEVARKTVGSGLGLAITKSLVETMGGRIRAENLNVGSQFTVILPRGDINGG